MLGAGGDRLGTNCSVWDSADAARLIGSPACCVPVPSLAGWVSGAGCRGCLRWDLRGVSVGGRACVDGSGIFYLNVLIR